LRHCHDVFPRSNALRWNAYTPGRLSLNTSNETGYVEKGVGVVGEKGVGDK